MYCMFEEYECLTLPPPSPIDNATCREPYFGVVPGVNHRKLEGDWYVPYGFNTDYDCFGCQILTFEFPKNQPIFYEALYNLIAVNGSLIWNDIVMHGDESSPGIFTLHGHDSGFDNTQQWYFLMQSDDTVVVYYCGELMTWRFEGALVLSRSKTFDNLKTQ